MFRCVREVAFWAFLPCRDMRLVAEFALRAACVVLWWIDLSAGRTVSTVGMGTHVGPVSYITTLFADLDGAAVGAAADQFAVHFHVVGNSGAVES